MLTSTHTSASDPATYPNLGNQNVSDAAQNCHTVKNIPGIFEIILWSGQERQRDEEEREQRRAKWKKGEVEKVMSCHGARGTHMEV